MYHTRVTSKLRQHASPALRAVLAWRHAPAVSHLLWGRVKGRRRDHHSTELNLKSVNLTKLNFYCKSAVFKEVSLHSKRRQRNAATTPSGKAPLPKRRRKHHHPTGVRRKSSTTRRRRGENKAHPQGKKGTAAPPNRRGGEEKRSPSKRGETLVCVALCCVCSVFCVCVRRRPIEK